jgi:hypothetical protein
MEIVGPGDWLPVVDSFQTRHGLVIPGGLAVTSREVRE